jgi:hypothetical protein
MEETSKIETGQLGAEFSLAPRSGYFRPVIPTVLYLAAFLALEWSVSAFGFSESLGRFSLTTGLNLGLMMAYGLWYAPVVAVTIAADGIWLHPFPFSIPMAMSYCLAVALVQAAAAASLRYLSSGRRVSLNTGTDVARFIGIGVLGALMLGAAATAPSISNVPVQWGPLLNEFLIHFTGFAAGVSVLLGPVIHMPLADMELSGTRARVQTLLGQIESFGPTDRDAVRGSFIGVAGPALYFILAEVSEQAVHLYSPIHPFDLDRSPVRLEALSVAVPVLLLVTLVALVWRVE